MPRAKQSNLSARSVSDDAVKTFDITDVSSSQRGDAMEDHARQELIEEYFSSSGVGAPEVEGFVWLKADNKKSWKKFYFVLRSSGLYYAPKGKKTSKDLVCLATFDVNQVKNDLAYFVST